MATPNMRVRYTVDIKIDQAALNHMLKSPFGVVGQFIAELGVKVEMLAKSTSPVSSGDMRRSIEMTRGTSVSAVGVEVTIGVPYAMDVHQGIGPRDIVPRRKKALRFPNKAGQIVYAAKVHQEARPANPFLWNALRNVVDTLN